MDTGKKSTREKIVLHLCCAPCSPHPINLLEKDFDITLFFYNPNIHPKSEYVDRLEEVKKLAKIKNLPLVVGDYGPDEWMRRHAHLGDEPEKGKRCEMCIEERLRRTAKQAAHMGINNFGAVLSVSPHKDAVMVNAAGRRVQEEPANCNEAVEVNFYTSDFKKKEGFKISSRIAKELGFKRQDYCGCVFSVRKGKTGAKADPVPVEN